MVSTRLTLTSLGVVTPPGGAVLVPTLQMGELRGELQPLCCVGESLFWKYSKVTFWVLLGPPSSRSWLPPVVGSNQGFPMYWLMFCDNSHNLSEVYCSGKWHSNTTCILSWVVESVMLCEVMHEGRASWRLCKSPAPKR